MKKVLGSINSVIQSYGILVLPIAILVPFGHFGFRPRDSGKGFTFIVVNFLCVSSYILALLSFIVDLININSNPLNMQFTISFALMVFLLYTIKIYKIYKKCNIVSLVKDIKAIRKHSLDMCEKICICFMILIMFSTIIKLIHNAYGIAMEYVKSGKQILIVKSENTVLRLLTILQMVIYYNSVWVLIYGYSFLIAMIAIVLKKEFNECIHQLENNITKENNLSKELFSTTIHRFYQLASVVHKVDKMFSDIIALIMVISMTLLCSSTFGLVTGDNSRQWMLLGLMSLVSLIILIPSPVTINTEVGRLCKSKL